MTISVGGTIQIDASGNTYTATDRISDTQMLVVFRDSAGVLGAHVIDVVTATKTFTLNATNTIAHAFDMSTILLARFSSTKFLMVTPAGGRARVLNVSGTTVTGAANTVLTDIALSQGRFARLFPLTSTTALYVYEYGTGSSVDAVARVLSIDGSDNVTEHSLLILQTDPSSLDGVYTAVLYSPTSAVYLFQDQDNSFHLTGQLFTISGTSLALSGSNQTLYSATTGFNLVLSGDTITSSEIVSAHDIDVAGSGQLICLVISKSGSTLSAGPALQLAATEYELSRQALATNSTTILLGGSDTLLVGNERITQITKLGTTLSHTASDFVNIANVSSPNPIGLAKITDDFALTTFLSSVSGAILGSDSAVVPVAGELTFAPMRKPCDVDADGDFLYIAALDSLGFPTLIKFSTDLDTDGTIVFQPLAGTDIGVQCGRFDSGVIYVGGAFGGTDVVEKSSDSGSSFSVIDPGTFGTVESFIVGPDSDDRVLISDVTNDDIQETIDGGTIWNSINSAVGFNILSIARLDRNVEEMVLGAESAATLNINYTVNSGDDTEDYTTGDFPESDVNSVIVN